LHRSNTQVNSARLINFLKTPNALFINMNKSEKDRYEKNKCKIDILREKLNEVSENPEQQFNIAQAVFFLRKSIKISL